MLPQKRKFGSSRGVALVLVLSFLVLMTVLVIAFFTTVTTELTTAKGSASESTARQLADSTAQLVMGSIRKATGGDSTTSWASQPGMVRTYDAAGNKLAYYKLYSSDNMVVSGKDQIDQFDFTKDDLGFAGGQPGDWVKQKAIFTDLNAPVTALDPSATGGTRTIYPIVDPSAKGAVAGFDIDTDPATSAVTATGNPAPMPVKWIYVLRDGTMTTPTSVDNTGQKALWAGDASSSKVPTVQNPIVGRVAYWTDDDTCKVNINTASEGSYWDTPRTYSVYDFDTLSQYQPFQHEYQRYPGHPATTSLSAVFANLTSKEDFYKIVPRTTGKGSTDGTMLPNDATNPSPLTIRTDRLYASIDEMMFQPNRQQNNNLTQSSGMSLSKNAFEQSKFFITSSSRAPDVNLFGKPRVSLWPITLTGPSATASSPIMTSFDQLLAFCSTIKLQGSDTSKSLYYFQRYDSTSPTTDLPKTNSSSTAPLYRNRTLLEYLRTLTAQPVPGFGNSLLNKYGMQDRDQILTEMFDYIRCTNLRDSTLGTYWNGQYTGSYLGTGRVVPIIDQDKSASGTDHLRGFGRFPTLEQGALLFIATDDETTNKYDSVKNPNGVKPNERRVQAVFLPQFFDPSQGLCMSFPWFTYVVKGLDSFTWSGQPMGFKPSWSPGHTIDWTGNQTTIRNVNFCGGSLDFRAMTYYPANAYTPGNPTSQYSCSAALSLKTGGPNTAPDMSTVNNPNQTFAFGGGDVTVEIHAVSYMGNNWGQQIDPPLQTVTLHFPPANFPIPSVVNDNTHLLMPEHSPGYPSAIDWKDFHNRFNYPNIATIGSNDVVRSVVATPGDLRLNAVHTTIDATNTGQFYQPHPLYFSTNHHAHTLYNGINRPFYGASGGKLVDTGDPSSSYMSYESQYNENDTIKSAPSLPTEWSWQGYATAAPHTPTQTTITQVYNPQVPGDWDNGVGNLEDGPYINKADEGIDTHYYDSAQRSYFYLQESTSGDVAGATFFSPNRLVQSPIEFGSLPSGVWATHPWQTLLFRPGPAMHFGLGTPMIGSDTSSGPYRVVPDHLWLDLFNMPVVEPYAISEPLSTAGRINMNYQLAPFTYIHRDTGVRAVLKAEKMLAIANSAKSPSGGNFNPYKGGTINTNVEPTAGQWNSSFRQDINLDATLKVFKARFDQKDLYRSASEICSIDLVPTDGPTNSINIRADMDNYWKQHQYVGDNSRERPYSNIYPRLTTKSNTFTVHMRVQTLQQAAGSFTTGATPGATWDENRDVVTSEYRGSQTIERYVDPTDPGLTIDYAAPAAAMDPTQNLESRYKFRVLMSKQFTP